MLSIANNERLTQVGPGTPMGTLMRRYWHPIAAAAELLERATLPVRLLGEDLVLYRDDPIAVELPLTADLEVVETSPGFKGDTAQGGTKPATLETGLLVQVPLFVDEGEKVRVDTRSGQYMARV